MVKLAIAHIAEAGFHEVDGPYYVVDNAVESVVFGEGHVNWYMGSSFRDWINDLIVRISAGSDEHILELNSFAPDLASTPAVLGDEVYRSLRVLPLDLRQGRRRSFPDYCLLKVYQFTRTHSLHPLPRPGHSFRDWSVVVRQCTRRHPLRQPPRPDHSFPIQLNFSRHNMLRVVPGNHSERERETLSRV